MDTGTPVQWASDGIGYAGLAWGDDSLPPALAIHGWMDNALSFARLGPLVKKRRLIALDMSGHGLSDVRSADSTYQIWDDTPQLLDIVAGWNHTKVTLIGHSKGASQALLLALALGNRCDRLIMLDGLLPPSRGDADAAEQFIKFVREREKYRARAERIFANVEEFIDARRRYGFSEDNARALAPRALEVCSGGYRLRADPRLFGASVIRMDASQRESYYRALQPPVLAIFGTNGFYRQEPALNMEAEAAACIPDFRSTILPGSHHLHLEDEAEQVAWRIDSFIQSGI